LFPAALPLSNDSAIAPASEVLEDPVADYFGFLTPAPLSNALIKVGFWNLHVACAICTFSNLQASETRASVARDIRIAWAEGSPFNNLISMQLRVYPTQ
jgi:hypothetical protein